MTSTDPGHLRTWLSGTKFPADKSDLIHQAEQNDAPGDVLAALREMPPATYGNRAEVASSVRIPEQQTDTEKAGERRRHSHSGRAETEAETPTNPIAEVRGDNPKRVRPRIMIEHVAAIVQFPTDTTASTQRESA